MNLSELIHRSIDDSSPTVVHHHSTYDPHQFQTTPTRTTVDAMQLYNNEVLESSRFVTTKNNDDGIYSPAKTLPMSSPTTSSSSWHYNSTMGESSRSPYASTLSDQSDRPRLLLPDSPPPPTTLTITPTTATTTTTTTTTTVVSSIPSPNNNTTASTMMIREQEGRVMRADTPGSTDSPVSPIPMDRSPRFITEEDSTEFHQHHNHYQPNDNNNNSIATLYARKNNNKTPILTITGETVTKENIEEGYVQFILHHDPQSINDSIESLMYVKRKFSSVPKTGDLAYTTWDVFTSVKKLHNQQIKNWSQLVGQLGLSDMTGRPQFAQRVKRWMRKYRIDCYFDYLLGNPYNFHSPDEKNTGCLMMGNYQKRNNKSSSKSSTPIMTMTIADETGSVKSSSSNNGIGNGRTRKRSRYYLLTDEDDNDEADVDDDDDDDDEEEENNNNNNNNGTSDDESKRKSTPIVLAGSRKRARMSPHHVSTENFRFSKTLLHQHRLSELENNDDTEDDEGGYDGHKTILNDNNDEMDDEDEEQEDNENDDFVEDNQMEEGDEEDELASTSSSSSSTISQPSTTITNDNNRSINNNNNNNNTTTVNTSAIPSLLLNNNDNNNNSTTTIASITQAAGPSTSSLSPLVLPSLSTSSPPSCSNCNQIQSTVHSLQNDVNVLKEQVLSLQNKLDQEISSKQAMEKRLSSICSHYDNWRSKLAIQLLQNPFNPDRMDFPSNLNNNNNDSNP